MKPLIMGQAPARMNPDALDLGSRSWKRLISLSGLGQDLFMETFDVLNLLPAWPGRSRTGKGDTFLDDEAARRAEFLLKDRKGHVVCLGKRVTAAVLSCLELEALVPKDPVSVSLVITGDIEVHCIPHPSGISKSWNRMFVAQEVAGLLKVLAMAEEMPEAARVILDSLSGKLSYRSQGFMSYHQTDLSGMHY